MSVPVARFCTACGAALPAGARFCPQCGQAVAATAPASHFTPTAPATAPEDATPPEATPAAQPGRARDAAAGSDTAPAIARGTGERRQVAVLFADIAGYTQLSSTLDPEEVHRLLTRYFEEVDGIVVRYGGSVDKHIGDAVMAVFGAPVAHADDGERAVRAACDVHRAMERLSAEFARPLAAHVGIAAGEVVAAGTGSASHSEYTVTGDAVNLASRLDGLAAGGQTLVSGPLYRSVAHRVSAEPAGEIAVKGFAQPVETWRVLGLRETGAASTLPLVGRRAERRQFAGALESVADTGGGQTLLLRGEAGIGKTRLTEEFRAMAQAAGFACHTGLVLDFGVARGRGAIASIAAELLDAAADADEATRQRALADALARGAAAADDEAFLDDLLDLPQPEHLRLTYQAMDSAARARGRQQALRALVDRAAQARPRLLVVEDLHWADPLTLESVATLAQAAAASRTILLATTRVEGDPLDARWRAALGPVPLLTLDLSPLGSDEAVQIAREFAAANESFVRDCVRRAEGNPLFLVQLLHSAQEGAAVPASIRSLVLSRIDRLAPADKAAIQAAAVIGQRFPLELLRHLVDDPAYRCDALIDHRLVRPEGEELLFAHALICDGAYASLLNTRKRDLHREAAGWYAGRDPVLRARHLDRAGDPEAPRALREAARTLIASLRPEGALELAQRASALATDATGRWEAAMLEGELLRDVGRTRDSIAAYARAGEHAPDDAARCRALIGVAAGHRIAGEPDAALAALDVAGPLAERLELTLERATIHTTRGNLRFARGEVDLCLAEHQAALAAARAAGDALAEAGALSGLGDARYAQGRMRTAYERFRECVELARAGDFIRVIVPNLCMVGHSRCFLNQFDAASADMTAAGVLAESIRQPFMQMFVDESKAMVDLFRGERDACARAQSRALAMARQIGSRRYEAILLFVAGRLDLQRGDRGSARANGEEALRIVQETGTAGFIGAAIHALLALAADSRGACAAELEAGEALLERGSLAHCHFWFHSTAIEAAVRFREPRRVRHHCAALERFGRHEPLPWIDLQATRGRALARWLDGERGEASRAALEAVRTETARCGFGSALPALDEALSAT
jgi:class 3 adenylate cyclase/tetratricopeptide (TPR) repeat protein